MFYFWLSVTVLALLLYLPVTRLIWVLSVRRLQRKRGGALSADESVAQLTRARFIAVIVCAVTALLFNLQSLGWPGHG